MLVEPDIVLFCDHDHASNLGAKSIGKCLPPKLIIKIQNKQRIVGHYERADAL